MWCALEKLGNAVALATHVHDGVEHVRGHLRFAELLGFLDEASNGGGDGDGDGNTAPWGQSPCFYTWMLALGYSGAIPSVGSNQTRLGADPSVAQGHRMSKTKFSLSSTG